MEVKDLKLTYRKLSDKYKIPGFDELNDDFEIGRIERDSGNVLRDVRKAMMDKIVGYIRFLEMILNPAQAPPMFMIFVKEVTESNNKVIQNVYKSFIDLELQSLKLDIDYSESGEAKLVKNIFSSWSKAKPDMKKVIEVMEKNWYSSSVKKEKGYFG